MNATNLGEIMDITAFVTARLDEDKHWAHIAEAGWPPVNALAASEDPEHYAFMATDITPSKATFIRRNSPERIRRDVEAKRKILAEHKPVRHEGRVMCGSCLGTVTYWPCPTLRYLGAAWDDHPDYDPAWAPS